MADATAPKQLKAIRSGFEARGTTGGTGDAASQQDFNCIADNVRAGASLHVQRSSVATRSPIQTLSSRNDCAANLLDGSGRICRIAVIYRTNGRTSARTLAGKRNTILQVLGQISEIYTALRQLGGPDSAVGYLSARNGQRCRPITSGDLTGDTLMVRHTDTQTIGWELHEEATRQRE